MEKAISLSTGATEELGNPGDLGRTIASSERALNGAILTSEISIYVMAGLSRQAFAIYCVVFMVIRILHTFFYLNAVQPWRTVAFTIGAVAMLALVIHLLIRVVA